MRVSAKARALLVCTVTAGAAAVAVAVWKSLHAPLPTLALLAAGVILTELFHVAEDEEPLDPVDAHAFTFSSAVHLAAVLLLGPWAAALVAATGVVCVDRLRGDAWRKVLFNASVFALAALAAGTVFQLLGGRAGELRLPHDFAAVAAMAAVYTALNLLLVNGIVAFSNGVRAWPLVRHAGVSDLSAAIAESGLGLALAFLAEGNAWDVVVLVPLLLAVYQAHARLAQLRRETARALETFANVVDERDPYTYRHSERVAEYVRALGDALALPAAEVARLRWAGRLHDLGKIAVDAGVLRKPAQLADHEWREMQRHPRLSARLLRRFRFAADEARAVEYHHERFDGGGYYRIDGAKVPLAAHFLIVADSFDAMTSERPYRPALSREHALAELERGAGSQFHPAVAKAFVALQRDEDVGSALDADELRELRELSLRTRAARTDFFGGLGTAEGAAIAGVIATLAAVAADATAAALAGAAVAVAALVWRAVATRRGRALAATLHDVVQAAGDVHDCFAGLAGVVAATAGLQWAALVSWADDALDGRVCCEWQGDVAPPLRGAFTSWLIRESEARDAIVRAPGSEVGMEGQLVAVPLSRGGAVAAHLVLTLPRPLPLHLERALRDSRHLLAAALLRETRDARDAAPPVAALAAVS